jgi:hypothetical protein
MEALPRRTLLKNKDGIAIETMVQQMHGTIDARVLHLM